MGRHRNQHRPYTRGIQRRLFPTRSTGPTPKARRQTPGPGALVRGTSNIARFPRGAVPQPRPHATRRRYRNGHAGPRAVQHPRSLAAWDDVRWPQAEVQQGRDGTCSFGVRLNRRGIGREGRPSEKELGGGARYLAFAATGGGGVVVVVVVEAAVDAAVDAAHGKREPGTRLQPSKRLRPEAGQQEDLPPPGLWRGEKQTAAAKRKGASSNLQRGTRHHPSGPGSTGVISCGG